MPDIYACCSSFEDNKVDYIPLCTTVVACSFFTTVITGLNDYLLAVAEKQIYLAFEHAQNERELLSKRTAEGLKQAKLMGSKVGRQKGDKIVTKKQKRAKRVIRKYYSLFGGPLTATQCFNLAQITKSTFYRYIEQMRQEDLAKGIVWNDESLVAEADDKDLSKEEVLELIKDFNK